MTLYVPQQYLAYVKAAAAYSGLPINVVIAQITLESDWDPTALSPTGAQGIAQFEPGTWQSWGTGSPDNPADAFPAYARFMRSLLDEFGGNIRDALAGYNAGPGNLPAGYGYADTILANAGEGYSVTAGTGGSIALPSSQAIQSVVSGIAQDARMLIWTRMGIRAAFKNGWR